MQHSEHFVIHDAVITTATATPTTDRVVLYLHTEYCIGISYFFFIFPTSFMSSCRIHPIHSSSLQRETGIETEKIEQMSDLIKRSDWSYEAQPA